MNAGSNCHILLMKYFFYHIIVSTICSDIINPLVSFCVVLKCILSHQFSFKHPMYLLMFYVYCKN